MSHNLEEMGPGDQAPDWVECFTRWMAQRLAAGDQQALLDYRARAPAAPRNHPTEEHLLPLFVALGAAGDDWRATRLHASVTRRALAMDAYRFDPVA
jgi:4,5-DOPA dioxygenase extradiol